MKKLNIKRIQKELLDLATSRQVCEQLNGVEQRMLYNAVYALNKVRLNNVKKVQEND